MRYFLLGFSQDILEVLQLAKAGGVGPVGPTFERLFWHESEGIWREEPEEV